MAKKDGRPKDLHYFNIGPWPGYVGFTTCEKAFAKEMKRLRIPGTVDYLPTSHANAATHFLEKNGKTIAIIVMPKFNARVASREMYVALLAHEAMHVIQQMQEDLARGKTLGSEAEAYLIQQIVQECLQIAWASNKVIRREPA